MSSIPHCLVHILQDSTLAISPNILLSYATSVSLGILEFKVCNLAVQSQIDTLSVPTLPTPGSLKKTAKHVTFHDLLLDLDQSHCKSLPKGLCSLRKTACPQVHFSDKEKAYSNGTWHKHPSTTTGKHQPNIKSSPHKPITPTNSVLKVKSTQATSPCSPSTVWDIIALKQAFPGSFDTIGNMSRSYTIRTDPSITPVQHALRKVPIKQIEHTLDEMVEKGVIAPVSWPIEWVSSLKYPHKPDGTLHICLNPKDLKKAIV